jgi:hypothetical protein
MTWGWPQFLMASLMLIGEGISLARYGEKKRDSYGPVDVLIGPVAVAWILYMGGFWTP